MSILAKSLTACALGALLAGASVNAYALDAEHKADWSKIHILLVPWSQSSNSFFEAVVNGAKDAAEQQGVQVDIQFGEEDQNREKTILETAVAKTKSTALWSTSRRRCVQGSHVQGDGAKTLLSSLQH
jgi:ABC-type sugar transport system substrate-binding protein